MGAITNRRFNYHSMGQYYQLDENDMPIDISQSIDHEPCNDGEYWMTNCSCYEPPLLNNDNSTHIWQTWKDFQTAEVNDVPSIVTLPMQFANVKWYSPFTGEPDVPIMEGTFNTAGNVLLNVAGADLTETSPIRMFKLTPTSGRVASDEQASPEVETRKFKVMTDAKDSISIWPNPTAAQLWISLSNADGSDPVSVGVYDSHGRLITSSSMTKSLEVLNTSEFSNGVYYIHFIGKTTNAWKRFQKVRN